MSDKSQVHKITKLNHDNYSAWVFRAELLLRQEGVWNVLTSPLPDEGDSDETRAAHNSWKARDEKARTIIGLAVEDNQLVYIKKCATAKLCWDSLKSNHKLPTLGARLQLYEQIFSEKLTYNGSMREHLGKLMGWFDDLSEMDAPLPDDIAVGVILTSVSKVHKNLVTAMGAWSDDRLTLQSVKAKLMEEHNKRQSSEAPRGNFSESSQRFNSEAPQRYWESTWESARRSAEAATNKFNNNPRFNSEASRRNSERRRNDFSEAPQRNIQVSNEGFLCHNCGQPGHFRNNCPQGGKQFDLRNKLNAKHTEDNDNKDNEGLANVSRHSEWYTAKSFNGNQVENWIVDSGATQHMCKNEGSFFQLDITHKGNIIVANGNKTPIMGKGNVRLTLASGNDRWDVELKDVLWVPGLNDNLVSVNQLGRKGYTAVFTQEACHLSKGSQWFCVANHMNGLYTLNNAGRCLNSSEEVVDESLCIHEWHRRLAHRNLADIRRMRAEGIKIKDCSHSDDCEACIKGKMARRPFPKKATPTEAPLDCIACDLCGPIQVESVRRKKYVITFTDLYSRHTEVEFLRKKSEAAAASKNYIEKLKTQFGRKPKAFRTDRGTEFLNESMESYLKKEGIKMQHTVGYAAEQNGVAERKNRTLMEAARSMLTESDLPKCLWAEAVATAAYTFNRIVNKNGKTPYELMHGMKPPKIAYHEFGCDVYAMVPDEKRRKLDDKAEKMKFVGYDENAKGYRLVNAYGQIHISREVRFLENTPKPQEDNDFEWIVTGNSNEEEEEIFDEKSNYEFNDTQGEEDDFYSQEEETQEEEVQHEIVLPRRSTRVTRQVKPYQYGDRAPFFYSASCKREPEPRTFTEAINSTHSNEWLEAMNDELDAIEENQTWEVVDLPHGRRAIGSKWVFKTKLNENGAAGERKARLVAQGFSQKFGEDYDEVFAPVARTATLRMLLSVAGKRNYSVNHYDIKTAFLNGTLKEEVFMKQPPGFQNGSKVLRLKKSLYGLKQSARVWNQTLHEQLEVNGCKQNQTDKCLYVRKQDGKVCYLIIHVDDILVATNSQQLEHQIMGSIAKKFELKNLGGVKHYLGIDIERLDGKFFISQPRYIDTIVEAASLEDAKISKHPLDTGYQKQEGELLDTNEEFRKLIGMLLYLVTNTRPDIAASVSILSKNVQKPRDNDMLEVKRVIRYLKGTRDLKLQLNDTKQVEVLHAYSDASWAEDKDDRKSTTGYYCSVNGGAISWSSRKQNIVTLSSCEAEYVALTETCKEVTWLREIASAFEIKNNGPTTIFTDSQSCIAIIENQKFSNRTKHIDARYHFIKDQVGSGRIKLIYCPTNDNIADLMTKPLGFIKMEALRTMAGLSTHNPN